MPITVLSFGPRHTMLQNVVYVLPAAKATIFSNVALEGSMDPAFAASEAIAADTPTVITSQYVRSTTGDATVKVSRD